MRKLSETLTESKKDIRPENILSSLDEREVESWQSLVLFDRVLDGERVLKSPEVETLAKYYYGQSKLSIAQTTLSKELQSFLTDLTYKGLTEFNSSAMIYPVKSQFEFMVIDGYDAEFAGPIHIVIIKPDYTDYHILVLTCRWGDNLFRNDHAVIGVIADTDDLEKIIEEKIK